MKNAMSCALIGALAIVALNSGAAHAAYTSVKECMADKAVNNSIALTGTIKFESLAQPSSCAAGIRVTFANAGSANGCTRCQTNIFVACDAFGSDASCQIKAR